MSDEKKQTLLKVEDLVVSFRTFDGDSLEVVSGVSFDIRRGETVGLVGESGSGKSVTALSIMRLHEEPPAQISGRILYSKNADSSVDIGKLKPRGSEIRGLRGNEIAMIFQEPMRALSPVFTVGHQIVEALRQHRDVSRSEARTKSVDMLDRVGLPRPERIVRAYPHELSGGQLQRCMIAMALICEPKLLIADEPTTALDVTIQAQILELLKELQKMYDLAVLLITHDLGVVAHNCERVNVMYMGRIVEHGGIRTIFKQPQHPYTRGLLKSVPVPGRGEKKRLPAIEGVVPDPRHIPPGCAFGPRCDYFTPGSCDIIEEVPVTELGDAHWSRCRRAREL